MAASGRGLSRALVASPRPAWRGAHREARGRLKPEYDAVVIGAGHNGLVAAAYLQRLGVDTAVFERRPVIGGAAVTEEIIPGFKFSRASYLLSLLRPQIYTDLELEEHGAQIKGENSPASRCTELPPGGAWSTLLNRTLTAWKVSTSRATEAIPGTSSFQTIKDSVLTSVTTWATSSNALSSGLHL